MVWYGHDPSTFGDITFLFSKVSVYSGAQYTLHQQKFPRLRSTVGCLIRAPVCELMSVSWDKCVPACFHDGPTLCITCFQLVVIRLLFGCDPDSVSSKSLATFFSTKSIWVTSNVPDFVGSVVAFATI